MRLRTRIRAFTLPLTLIPFLLTALGAYLLVIRAYERQEREQQDSLMAGAIAGLKKVRDAARRDLELMASLPITADYLDAVQTGVEPASGAEMKTVLQLFASRSQYCLQISVVDANGDERIKFSKLVGVEGLVSIKETDYFRRTLIHGQFQSPVEQVRPDRFASTLTRQVRSDRVLGAVVLLLNTDAFQTAMRPLLASHGFNSFLFDDRGFVFAKALGGSNEEGCLGRLDLASEASRLLALASPGDQPREVPCEAGSYQFSVYPAEAFTRSLFEPQSGENWFLGVLRSKQAWQSRTGQFQMLFFAVLIVAIAAVLWGTTRYARRVTVPLENVAKVTARIAQGDFDINVQVRTGDEVEELAAAVNRMAYDLKRYREELLRSSKLASIGEMASEISHEIQNRISGVSLWMQYLDAELESEDPRREYLEEMKQGLHGFNSLLSDLKLFYRTPLLHMSGVNLNDLVAASMPSVNQRIQEKAIRIELRLDPALPLVTCDGEKIKSVVLNLIVNSIEALDQGGRIIVQTCAVRARDNEPATGATLSVSDNGPGIEEEYLPRVFYPFYSTKDAGSGLGLAIVSNIVTAHGGSIDVRSRPGEGATFTVTLQTAQRASAPTSDLEGRGLNA